MIIQSNYGLYYAFKNYLKNKNSLQFEYDFSAYGFEMHFHSLKYYAHKYQIEVLKELEICY